jgi:hypothetical protein
MEGDRKITGLSIDYRPHIGDMLCRADKVHLPSPVRAGNHTAATAHAFLCIDKSLF